jgi:hypothetical protein
MPLVYDELHRPLFYWYMDDEEGDTFCKRMFLSTKAMQIFSQPGYGRGIAPRLMPRFLSTMLAGEPPLRLAEAWCRRSTVYSEGVQ